jgi:tetratricopeptide (TPR) repeat protein
MKPRISCRRSGFFRTVSLLSGVLLGTLAVVCGGRPAFAQPGRIVIGGGGLIAPGAAYHNAFVEFYDGDYAAALNRFKGDARGAIKTSQGRWIDSICYETMEGECHYQMGQYPDALSHFTAALELYQAFPDWLSQVRVEAIRADPNVKRPPPWQVRELQAKRGLLPDKMFIVQGQAVIPGQQVQPGPVNQANMFPIEAREIVRCTALAIHRRGELLGPLAAHDPLLDGIIAHLQRRPGQNQWADAWFSLELGMAFSAAGRPAAAIPALQKATLASGEFEHPLTAMAQQELGRIALAAGDFPTAAAHFEEASYAAYYFPDVNGIPDLDVLEEAFRYGALNHLLANGKGIFPPLAPAAPWARPHFHQLYVSLLTSAAENHLALGQTQQAMTLLNEARSMLGNRTMSGGRLAARRMFLEATGFYQARKTAEGDADLAKVMLFMRSSGPRPDQTGSLWLFHMQKVDEFYTGGGNGEVAAARHAIDLYPVVLRDPQPADWLYDPLESLAVMWVPHGLYFQHWFEAAVSRKEHELAIEVADRARRHRFLATLPFGGRLESLRWVLEGQKELLPPPALIQRQELFTRYPAYKDLLDQAEARRQELKALPLVQEDPEKAKKQGLAMEQLMAIGRKQELVLHEMALRRDPAAIAFPPLRTTAEIQKSLPPGHALLDFFIAGQNVYAFLLSHDKYAAWKVVATPQNLAHQSAIMLRQLGNINPTHELTPKDLADVAWRKTAKEILDSLLQGSRADFSTKFDELIIVPDGFLWYVPFETLHVQAGGQVVPLISRFRIRYVPTAGLAMATVELGRRQGNTAVVLGKLYPKMDDEAVASADKDLKRSLLGCVDLKMPLPAPGPIVADFCDRLLVLDELSPVAESDPYGWAPLPTDRTKTAGPLSEWFLLPRHGPDEMILPGYHTASEGTQKKIDASRRGGRGVAEVLGPGNEIFLSVCGMMATGTRTILISRWRSGGQTSLDLVREFTQELPHTTPADAWQRAVQVVSNSALSAENEPRIKGELTGQRASHPFFWAGFILVDSGSPLRQPEAQAAGR